MAFDMELFAAGSARLVGAPRQPFADKNPNLPAWYRSPLPTSSYMKGANLFAGSTVPTKNPNSIRRVNGVEIMPVEVLDSLKNTSILRVEGAPSIGVFLSGAGDATVTLSRFSRYYAYFSPEDKAEIRALAGQMLRAFEHHSRGPYSLRQLKQMGHPYGFGPVEKKTGRATRRAIPRHANGRAVGSVRGVRGSVPTLAVVNAQSGLFAKSWHMEMQEDEGGFTLRFWNDARGKRGQKYAWFLAAGTGRMQAHGPWTHVPALFRSQLDALHRRAVRRARERALAYWAREGGFLKDEG